MVQALHTLVWILTYSMSLMALVLAVVWNGREPGEYPRRVRNVVLWQTSVSALVTVSFQLRNAGFLDALGSPGRELVSGVLNASAYVTFALFATAVPGVFRQAPVTSRAPAERAVRLALVALALALAGVNAALVAVGGGTAWLSTVSAVGWILYGLLLWGSIGIAAVAAFRDGRRLAGTRVSAALFVALFGAFFFLELLPQAGGRAAGPPLYFLAAACFLVIGLQVAATVVRFLVTPPRTAETPAALGSLSPRENQIAALLAAGKSYKETAWELKISLSTVQTHVFRIYSKLGITNKVELANRLRV